MTPRTRDPLDRVLDRVTPGHGGCWIFTGREITDNGYGRVYVPAEGAPRPVRVMIHRLVHERLVGPIPDGFTVDHTCHNLDQSCPGGPCHHRRCVNPAHLEAVSNDVNAKRSPHANAWKTHCPHGHAYTPANTVINSVTGSRMCRTCRVAGEAVRRRRAGAQERAKPNGRSM